MLKLIKILGIRYNMLKIWTIVMQKKSQVDHSIASKKQEQEGLESRRSFIKKAAYAAPTLVALGTLMRPTEAKAGFGKPPSGPSW